MEFQVRGPAEDDLRSLVDWLTEDPAILRVRLLGPPPASGEQGSVFDVVQAVVSDGLALASFVISVKQWQASRPSPHWVEITDPDGTTHMVAPSEEEDGGPAQR